MTIISKLIMSGVILLIATAGAFVAASEFGGEVVTLRTYRDNGLARETTLWIIDYRRQLYLRAGDPNSDWLARIEEEPRVQLVRNGKPRDYRAVPIRRVREIVNERMAEKYGWADQLIGLVRDETVSVPVRLDVMRD